MNSNEKSGRKDSVPGKKISKDDANQRSDKTTSNIEKNEYEKSISPSKRNKVLKHETRFQSVESSSMAPSLPERKDASSSSRSSQIPRQSCQRPQSSVGLNMCSSSSDQNLSSQAYFCTECNKSFAHYSTYKRHVFLKHGGT